jgi:hypothetical protein
VDVQASFRDYPNARAGKYGFKAYILDQCTKYKLVAYDLDLPLVNMNYVVGGPMKTQISSKFNYDIDKEMWAVGFNAKVGSSLCGEVV